MVDLLPRRTHIGFTFHHDRIGCITRRKKFGRFEIQGDSSTELFETFAEMSTDKAVIHDARMWTVQCSKALNESTAVRRRMHSQRTYATVRFDLSDLIGIDQLDVLHTVLRRALIEFIETSQLIAFNGDN